MENNHLKQFMFNYKDIIVDEIALSGLEGVGFDQLCKHVERRVSSPILGKMKIRFWNFIVKSNSIVVYLLPEPLPQYELYDRFKIIDEESGNAIEPADYLDGPYEFCVVENEYGSCKHYNNRAIIPKENLMTMSFEQVLAEYGDRLVMVASIEERWRALAPHSPITILSHLSPTHYCILELVGRARENGQVTIGKTNLLKIVQDPKLMFYNRNYLEKFGLISYSSFTQMKAAKGVKTILLRLKRFHKPSIMTVPTTGRIHEVIEYLKEQPEYSQYVDNIVRTGILSHKVFKKLYKTSKLFTFIDEKIPIGNKKSKDGTPSTIRKKKMHLTPESDVDSANSDEEDGEETLDCQYNVKISLLRQAHKLFMNAGRQGLSRMELSQLLGVEFLTSRSICTRFKKLNIVREFMEDKGKQRTSRYIAVTATGEMDKRYEMEKKKFLQYLNDNNQTADQMNSNENETENEEVPSKKIKLEENDDENDLIIEFKNIDKHITEVAVLDGLKNSEELGTFLGSNKRPTLRQLRYANGILQVIQKKQVITGLQTLSILVGKEISEPPMDPKVIRSIIQKLVTEKQLKVFKMRRPGFHDEHVTLICSRNVKSTDSIIRTKYKELCTRAINNKKLQTKKILRDNPTRPISQYTYPRYMRIQKLHELICKTVLFGNTETSHRELELPKGFSSLSEIIPEFTIEFALGNISNYTVTEVPTANITENMLTVKLRDTPKDIYKSFILSSSLQNSIRNNLKSLAMLGLIQLVKEPTSTYAEKVILTYVFYVNRHAKIIDTTGTWPREDSNTGSLEKSFHFEKFEDVENYWKNVYNISIKTSIDLPNRPRMSLIPPTRNLDEVQTFDTGERYGDGKGACGFDSSFYMELAKLWFRYNFKSNKTREHAQISLSLPKRRKTQKPKVLKKKKKPIAKPISSKPILRKSKRADGSVQWTAEDDAIVTYCKAAMAIIGPAIHQTGLKLRNFVVKDILNTRDPKKTAAECHKRAMILESNSSLSHEKDCIISELKSRENIMNDYDTLMKRMRLRFMGSASRLMVEGRIPVLELVWFITQLVKSKNYRRRYPCVASNFEDFHKNYTITKFVTEAALNTYKTSDEHDLVVSTIKEGIMVTVIASHKVDLLPGIAKKIYNIFKEYSEQNLRLAANQLRKCNAIAAKDKILNHHLQKFHLQDVIQASYKLSLISERKIVTRLNSEFADQLTKYLDTDLSATSLNGCPGLNCLVCELLPCNIFDLVSLTVPAVESPLPVLEEHLNVSEVENKLTLKSGSCGLRGKSSSLKKLSVYLKDIEINENFIPRNADVIFGSCKNIEDKIISHLKGKLEKGSTFRELQMATGYKYDELRTKLSDFESKGILKRVGYYENLIVLIEYIKPWTINVDNTRKVPTIWLTIDNKVRYDILLTWASFIMNKIFEYPGSSICHLATENLTARNTQDVCVFLKNYKCIDMKVVISEEASIFSDDCKIPELMEYNEYEAMDHIVVFPAKDALTRYTYLKKLITDKYLSQEMDIG